ncbi:uncharacterized protein EKO05_0008791 [Ascochyta rabiei]|uniref:uncharacterized protein n=1 Tax=Didymella rabiei TaxID=5454 RepID=UPI0022079C9F|nr:uncharacterized protein EKO05_0008791 [Ascochyta rabiei]UPX18492.1 hypothetical protein EKO05_0008791 [Ascochyta rabiei]
MCKLLPRTPARMPHTIRMSNFTRPTAEGRSSTAIKLNLISCPTQPLDYSTYGDDLHPYREMLSVSCTSRSDSHHLASVLSKRSGTAVSRVMSKNDGLSFGLLADIWCEPAATIYRTHHRRVSVFSRGSTEWIWDATELDAECAVVA